MLSENSIEKLMEPLLTRQRNYNLFVLKLIAKRIKEIGTLTPSDAMKLGQMLRTGSDVRLINQELAKLTSLQVVDIKNIIKIAALDNYLESKAFYDYRYKSFIPFEENRRLQQLVTSISNQTANNYVNLSKSQAFMIRDLSNPSILKPTTLSKTYQTVIDEAIQSISVNDDTYYNAMHRTMNQLVDSGIRYVEYDSATGRRWTQRLDTAVRRNILDGVRAINQGVQDLVGEEFDANGVELSVHAYPAEDHALVQGRQFTKEEYEKMNLGESFEDVNGNKYDAFDRAIGTLNCRHFAWSIVIGVGKPNFSNAQLQSILERNEKGYTLSNGTHLTMYQCTQKQRELETKIRNAKDGQIFAKECGDMNLAKAYQVRINKYTNQYNAFSKACGIQTESQRTRVMGYSRISTKS